MNNNIIENDSALLNLCFQLLQAIKHKNKKAILREYEKIEKMDLENTSQKLFIYYDYILSEANDILYSI